MKRDADNLGPSTDLFSRLFDSSPAQVALLDLNGVILQTNRAWKQFGRENGLPAGYDCVGLSYLQACEPGVNSHDVGARQAYIGLLEVLRARRPKFTMAYPCHSPTERRWFRTLSFPHQTSDGTRRAVIVFPRHVTADIACGCARAAALEQASSGVVRLTRYSADRADQTAEIAMRKRPAELS
jgi:hypothetical protein